MSLIEIFIITEAPIFMSEGLYANISKMSFENVTWKFWHFQCLKSQFPRKTLPLIHRYMLQLLADTLKPRLPQYARYLIFPTKDKTVKPTEAWVTITLPLPDPILISTNDPYSCITHTVSTNPTLYIQESG